MPVRSKTTTDGGDCRTSTLATAPVLVTNANRIVEKAISLAFPAAEATTPRVPPVESDLVARLVTVWLMEAIPDATGTLVGRR
ncbi:hypothetical protein [Jiella marina]|uniref:hypothetical protein n=1 Tax=Jiella sp. LLJ827 TaxID=2917712 RepID=UPI002101094B|nr:hypothetical protein [Jiella sp. LLJ827]MCQ0989741.1 hypothetical protein [Jiella sp. LLJ827]